MVKESGYAVMKFVSGNGRCHKGSDYVKGRLLAEHFRERQQISKNQLFQWLKQVGKLLEQYHKCETNQYYRFVNPYMIVLTEEGELVLIDPHAESNQELIRQMQQEAIRSSFLPAEEPYYKRGSQSLDIYGLGRTMQFMLARSMIAPPLTKFEEYTFQKIIHKCLNYNSRKPYSGVSELLKNFPKPSNPIPNLRIILAIAATLIGIFIIFSNATESAADTIVYEPISVTAKEQVDISSITAELYLELGYVYLAQLNLPGESQVYFAQISEQNEVARHYERVAGYLQKQSSGNGGQELEIALSELERLSGADVTIQDYRIWMRAYALLNTSEARGSMIRIGEKALLVTEEREVEQEMIEWLAEAYQEEGEMQQALEKYSCLKQWTVMEKLEPVYLKIVGLYEETGDQQKALSECTEGVEKLIYSQALKIRHIKLLCQYTGEDKQVCEQIIQKYITEQPGIKEEDNFQKLQNEYGIKIEGDQVWIEKDQ